MNNTCIWFGEISIFFWNPEEVEQKKFWRIWNKSKIQKSFFKIPRKQKIGFKKSLLRDTPKKSKSNKRYEK